MAKFPAKSVATIAGMAVALGIGVAAYQNRPLTVAVIQPEREVVIKVFGLGTVEARVLSRVGFKVPGTLIDLQADHGDRVTEGQVLARIDDKEQKARLAKARAQVHSAEAAVEVSTAAARKAEAQLMQRKRTHQRRQELLARQAVSVEAAEEAQLAERVAQGDALVTKSEIETAKAKLDDARAQHDYEEVILNQHELRAPFAGLVAQRTKELGSVLAAGEALFTLVAPETVWTLAYVDEQRAGDIELGQPVDVKLRSLPRKTFKGRVARIGIESDRVNEERRVYVRCEECPAAFYLGEQAEVYITTAVLENALMVPEALIEKFDGFRGSVWAIENGTLRRYGVTLGHRSLDGRVQVTGGLPDGARVAATVTAGFREGRSVSISAGR